MSLARLVLTFCLVLAVPSGAFAGEPAEGDAKPAASPSPAKPDATVPAKAPDAKAPDAKPTPAAAEKKAAPALAPAPAKKPAPAAAGTTDDELEKLIDQASSPGQLGGWADKVAERPRTFPYMEHHGYFRFRTDLFFNGHLSTVIPGEPASGTSAVKAPLTENDINNSGLTDQDLSEDAKTIGGANLRFRYSPTIHVGQAWRIKATFDVLDNLVLGSTPDFAGNSGRPDVPLVAFTGGQVSPSAGVNGFRDAIRVTEAYGEWQPAFLLRVGRMASDWGLGILANGGKDIDDDYGDYADRALLGLKLFGVNVALAWDYLYSGATSEDPGDIFGQPHDLGGADDGNQWVLAIFQRPVNAAELEQRKIDLREKHQWAFDWGLYGIVRTQEFDLSNDSYAEWRSTGGTAAYDGLQLVPRRALAGVGDLWMRLEKRFNYFEGLRIELEGAGIFGKVENAVEGAATAERVIQQWGVALEVEYENDLDAGTLKVGLDAGVASGDDAEGFGVNDRNVLSEPDGSPNREVTAFKFDRNYHVDLLLFREVIGTVTNAFYIKPWASFDFFNSVEEALGVRLDLLYGQALEADATPGNDSFLGFEADLKLFYEDKGRFNFDVEAGFLVPGGAFDYIGPDTATTSDDRSAEFAFTIQARMTLQY